MAETTIIAAYSAMKKSDQRIPEYSVWKPATSSDSASGRSNGARLFSAMPLMRKTTKASGWWKRDGSGAAGAGEAAKEEDDEGGRRVEEVRERAVRGLRRRDARQRERAREHQRPD